MYIEKEGSLKGIVCAIEIKEEFWFVLHHVLTDQVVKCHFPISLVNLARVSVQKKVKLIGNIAHETGIPCWIKVTQIIVQPSREWKGPVLESLMYR